MYFRGKKKSSQSGSEDTVHDEYQENLTPTLLLMYDLEKIHAKNLISFVMMDFHVDGFHTKTQNTGFFQISSILGSKREICLSLRHQRPVRNRADPWSKTHWH